MKNAIFYQDATYIACRVSLQGVHVPFHIEITEDTDLAHLTMEQNNKDRYIWTDREHTRDMI